MGRTKQNDKSIEDPTYNYDANEYNQQNLEIVALAKSVGRNLSTLTLTSAADHESLRETLNFLTTRGDKASAWEHFTSDTIGQSKFSALNTAHAFAQVSGGTGVAAITCAAATVEGWTQAYDHFHQRSSYFRCRFQISAVPVGGADIFNIGLYRDNAHYIMFHCTDPSAPTSWTVEVNDGGATDSDTLVAAPAAATWHTFEILTTDTQAEFWYDRGEAAEEYKLLDGQAPENAYCHPYVSVTSAAGGEVFRCDQVGAQDTRQL
jgi:hypothetical protein